MTLNTISVHVFSSLVHVNLCDYCNMTLYLLNFLIAITCKIYVNFVNKDQNGHFFQVQNQNGRLENIPSKSLNGYYIIQ